MSFIECYEPEYVRNFMARHPDSPLYVRKVWKNEIRQSLMLTEPESCEAVLNDACAFDLQLTYRPVEENAAELSARCDSKPCHFEHPYAPRFNPGALPVCRRNCALPRQ